MKVTSNGGGTSIGQPIELIGTGRSQFEPSASYTLSFYARTDSSTNNISATVFYRNSKFSGTNQVNWGPTVTQNMGTMTTTFQRFSKTFTAPAAPNANNQVLAIEFNNSATYYITGIQFEKGAAATPFEHRSFGDELARCQRYFCRLQSGANYVNYGMGGAYSSTQAVAQVNFPVSMRGYPTFSYNGALNTYYDIVGGFGSFSAMTMTQAMGSGATGYQHANIQVVGSGTAGNPFMLATLNNTNTYMDFNSEI